MDAVPALARVIDYGPRERAVRGVRTWLGLWGLAVAAVFVPLLHFVLVPGLLVGGVLMGLLRARERGTIVSVRGRCPACSVEQTTALKAPLVPAVSFRCASCGRPLWLHVEGIVAA